MEQLPLINKFNIEKKNIISIVVIIFTFIIGMIFILIALYYLTPNNYILIMLNDDLVNKFNLVDKIEYTIGSGSNTSLFIGSDEKNTNKYLRFSDETNLIIKNFFKSQNIIVNKDTDLIKSKYNSEIFIINNSDTDKKIIVQYYTLL